MKIRVGYELIYDFPQPTPMIMVLGTHFTRASGRHRARLPDHQPCRADLALSRRATATGAAAWSRPPGRMRLSGDGVVRDSAACPTWSPRRRRSTRSRICRRRRSSISLGSRYCETDRLSEIAWQLFGKRRRAGRACRRSAITSMATSPSATSMRAPTKTAWEAYQRRQRASAATTPISPSPSAAA